MNMSDDDILDKVTRLLLEDDEFARALESWCATRCDAFGAARRPLHASTRVEGQP